MQLAIKKSYVSGWFVQKKVRKPVGNIWANDIIFGFFCKEQYAEEWVYVDEFLNETTSPVKFETRDEAEQFIKNVNGISEK